MGRSLRLENRARRRYAAAAPDIRADPFGDSPHTSVYTLRVKVPGNSHPWYKRRGQ